MNHSVSHYVTSNLSAYFIPLSFQFCPFPNACNLCESSRSHGTLMMEAVRTSAIRLPQPTSMRLSRKAAIFTSHSRSFRQVRHGFVFLIYLVFCVLDRMLNLNSVNQLIFVMVKCGVLFEVRTGFLNKM
jgi:hypothetical protein